MNYIPCFSSSGHSFTKWHGNIRVCRLCGWCQEKEK
jgi:hypothetical protein